MKTLADFKQEVAEKYGFDKWYKLLDSLEWESVPDLCDEAAELYAAYRAQEAKEKVIEDGFELLKINYNNGWNEALDCAAEKVGPVARKIILNLKK